MGEAGMAWFLPGKIMIFTCLGKTSQSQFKAFSILKTVLLMTPHYTQFELRIPVVVT